jgi:hypothetical protein
MDTAAREEWLAWRTVCGLLGVYGIDVDGETALPLVRAIRHYAEMYRVLYEGTGDRQPFADRDAEETRALYPGNV